MRQPYRTGPAGTVAKPLGPGAAFPVGQRVAPQRFAPPNPWGGDWQPTDDEFMRWGASAQLVAPSAPSAINGGVLEIGVLDCTMPVPLPCVVTLSVEFLSGVFWSDVIEWSVGAGVGRSVAQLGPNTPQQGPPAAAGRQYAPVVQTFQVPLRQVRIGCRLTPGTLPMLSQAVYRVSAQLAPIA